MRNKPNINTTTSIVIGLSLLLTAYIVYHIKTCDQNSFIKTRTTRKKTLNIHFVSHTHDDVGWLKTVDQYFEGKNNTIQNACVNCILDSVVKELQNDSKRKFTYVEMAYFSMWWDLQTPETKNEVRKMVANQQLSFVNGGWCMHDEATTHFMGMIDQTTLGHDFLKREFDFIPSVAWQLDPFGHSATQASLLGSEAGFDAIYFGRIDYQDLSRRQKTKNCEGIWDSSPNLDDTSIFFGLTGSYNGNYGAPNGFCFDINCDDELLVGLPAARLHDRVFEFMKDVQTQASRTRGDNVMLTMGSDFQYSNASVNFENLDLLISVINQKKETYLLQIFSDYDDIKAFYSTPNMYTNYKYEEFEKDEEGQMNFEVKTDADFFPYSDCPHCFWTGYFTSRPALKRLERVGSSFLQLARQIQAIFTTDMEGGESILELEKAMGIIQHHDGVSGTSKQHVANDYAKRVQSGIDAAASFVSNVIKTLFNDIDDYGLSDVTFCQLLNESICELSQDVTKSRKEVSFFAVIYNSIPHIRNDVVTIPVSLQGPYTVKKGVRGENNTELRWEEVSSDVMLNLKKEMGTGSAPFSLHFDPGIIDPISMSLYKITKQAENNLSTNFVNHSTSTTNFTISNGVLEIEFDRGGIKRLSKSDDETSLEVDKKWGYYPSFPKIDVDKPASGAYIFRPKTPDEMMTELELDASKTLVRRSSMLTEVHLNYKVPWIKEVIKLYKNKPYVEIDYTIGPIDINDGTGKEVVMRLNSTLKNEGVFFTDSNAREFIKRKRSERSSWTLEEFEPVAGNFYPVNAAIFIEDDSASMAILPDRSQGGTSLVDGSIELMVHRRILHDDSRGVAEPLNETSEIMPYPPYGDGSRRGDGIIITGTFRILIGAGNSGARLARSEMDNIFSPLHLFTARSGSMKSPKKANPNLIATILSKPFPENLQLITYKFMSKNEESFTYLLRLGHKYGLGESDDYSLPVVFNVSSLFRHGVMDMKETTLTGNNDKITSKMNKKQWIAGVPSKDYNKGDTNETIIIYPMQIKTFLVKVSRKNIFEEEIIQSVA